MGLLVYSVVTSTGYYGQNGNWGIYAMFIGLRIISMVLVLKLSAKGTQLKALKTVKETKK